MTDTVNGLRAGTLSMPKPTVGRLSDGTKWLYAGMVNGLAGEPGCGKTWTALHAAATELEDGHPVVIIDFENGMVVTVGRLLALGVNPTHLLDPTKFAYISPEEAFALGAAGLLAVLRDMKPTLVVIDSTGESMTLEGCDPNADDAVAKWFRNIPTRISNTGPAVLLLDHVPKSDSGASSPIGSQRKRAAISGAQFIQQVKKGMAFAKGTPGEAVLTCTKDRHGNFVTGEAALTLIVNPNPARTDGVSVSLAIGNSTGWAPTKQMALISTFMETAARACTTTEIKRNVTGKADTLTKALSVLVESGYLTMTGGGPGKAKEYTFVKPYQNGDPIVVPGEDEPEADPEPRRSGKPLCTEHEFHAGDWCNPQWCHVGHYGRCNREGAAG